DSGHVVFGDEVGRYFTSILTLGNTLNFSFRRPNMPTPARSPFRHTTLFPADVSASIFMHKRPSWSKKQSPATISSMAFMFGSSLKPCTNSTTVIRFDSILPPHLLQRSETLYSTFTGRSQYSTSRIAPDMIRATS